MEYFLKAFGIFSDEEIASFIKLGSFRKLKKGAFFVQDGKTCTEVAFVQSGTLRSFYNSANGEEMTYCITFPNAFMTGYSSFITGNPSIENIQTISDAELIVFSKKDIDHFAEQHPNGMKFQKHMAEQQYMELEKRIFLYQQQTAMERYRELMVSHPEYIGQIPLQYLASYLGITTRHLSRLRKEMLVSSASSIS